MREKRILAFICCLCVCAPSIMLGEKRTEIRYENDLKPHEEILEEVQKTHQTLLNKAAGIPEPKKPKDPRSKFYVGINIGGVYSPNGGFGYIVGAEAGYNFVVQKDNSLRVFVFFDRFANNFSTDFNIDASKPDLFQIYRMGISAEYRAYVNPYFGFKVRLVSFGVNDLARTSSLVNPELTRNKKVGFLPTIGFGPVFNYKFNEIFIGLDMLEYSLEYGPTMNFVQYSLRF
ncbi:hypothetical protein [uncultured Helicobacter sp.]|uniref:hypothetical protein n=1 Tax=uncultured Helicobacter sp. TaxID=175537 RepID=UPI00374F1FA5